jgi:hypothetical protein
VSEAQKGTRNFYSTNPLSRSEEYAKEVRGFSFGRQRMLPVEQQANTWIWITPSVLC